MKGDLVDIVLTAVIWGVTIALVGLAAFALGLAVGWFG